MGSAHPQGGPAGPFCTDLLRHCSQVKRIFSCGYRLASSTPFPAANPFPAAVLDSLAGYNYLVHTVGFQPQHIFICGDSAGRFYRVFSRANTDHDHLEGGNLAIALIRYLAQNTFSVLSLPVPRGLILVSPTVEWGITHNATNSSWRLNRGSDFSGPFFRGYTLRSLLGNLPVDFAFKSPWISPASPSLSPYDENLFKGFPTTFIMAGEAEIALDSIETFRDRLSQNIGEDNVSYIAMKDGESPIDL
jgi:acetyl esterase/lipase